MRTLICHIYCSFRRPLEAGPFTGRTAQLASTWLQCSSYAGPGSMIATSKVNCVFCLDYPGRQLPGYPVSTCEVCRGRVQILLTGAHPLRRCHFCEAFPGRQPPGSPIRRCVMCNGSGYLTADGEAPIIHWVAEVSRANAMIESATNAVASITAAGAVPKRLPTPASTSDAAPSFSAVSGDQERRTCR